MPGPYQGGLVPGQGLFFSSVYVLYSDHQAHKESANVFHIVNADCGEHMPNSVKWIYTWQNMFNRAEDTSVLGQKHIICKYANLQILGTLKRLIELPSKCVMDFSGS